VARRRQQLERELKSGKWLPRHRRAGFTREVYDRVPDANDPNRSRLEGPKSDQIPVGMEFLGRPFEEAKLFEIASAYETGTKHRRPPKAFAPLKENHISDVEGQVFGATRHGGSSDRTDDVCRSFLECSIGDYGSKTNMGKSRQADEVCPCWGR
jgi:hypothetical protein